VVCHAPPLESGIGILLTVAWVYRREGEVAIDPDVRRLERTSLGETADGTVVKLRLRGEWMGPWTALTSVVRLDGTVVFCWTKTPRRYSVSSSVKR
jgi:hypothetical protein